MKVITEKQIFTWLITLLLVPFVNVAFQKNGDISNSTTEVLKAFSIYWLLNVVFSFFALTIVCLIHSVFVNFIFGQFKVINRWAIFSINLSTGLAFILLYDALIMGEFFWV